jgi:diguanylate cyclase (GGDEF)-like protein
MNICEILSWVFDTKLGMLNYYLNFIFNFAFTAFGTVIVALWAYYIDYLIFRNVDNLKKKWYYSLPPIIMILLSIINIFTPILFNIDSNNVYSRLPLIWTSIPLILMLYLYILILVSKSAPINSKKIIIGILIFLSLPIIGAVLQLLYYGLHLIWPSTALAILISYLIFESTSNSKDFLTGVYTRERAEEQIEKYLRSKKELSVIMVDLDNFKYINDTYGHHFGDEMLVRVSSLLEEIFSENSLVARYGGDEFLIVTEITDQVLISKKRNQIQELVSKSKTSEIHDLKISFGVTTCYNPELRTSRELIIEADNNMYKDKEKMKKNA